jgi:hypothetical protein
VEGVRLSERFSLPRRSLYAVSIGTLVTRAGNIRYSGDPVLLREKLRLPSDAQLMLIGTAKDYLLELFWKRSERRDLWAQLARFDFKMATTLTFSVWGNDPRFDQIYNHDRNAASYEILTELGIPTIPVFYPAESEDYEAAANWLDERPHLTVIASVANFHRSGKPYERHLLDIKRLTESVKQPLTVTLLSPSTLAKIEKADAIFGRRQVRFVTSQPIMKATYGQKANLRLEFEKALDERREALIEPNLAFYDAAYGST